MEPWTRCGVEEIRFGRFWSVISRWGFPYGEMVVVNGCATMVCAGMAVRFDCGGYSLTVTLDWNFLGRGLSEVACGLLEVVYGVVVYQKFEVWWLQGDSADYSCDDGSMEVVVDLEWNW